MSEPEPGAEECLARTRSGVLNVLVLVGAGIASSGWTLSRHDPTLGLPWGLSRTRQASMVALVGLVAASYMALRLMAGREALRDPTTRASRFYRGRMLAAGLAALAVPLGFAHGWFLDPRLPALAPYWVAALALGVLAFPRGNELDDFEDASS